MAAICCCAMHVLLYAQATQGRQSPRNPDRQQQKAPPHRRPGPEPPEAPAPGIGYVSSEFRFGGKVVKNAPYSAEAVTESTQVLSNGAKLNQKATALIFRDGEGRIRREQKSSPVGPFAASGETQRVIFISDPVAGIAYTLYPDSHTGFRTQLPPVEVINAADPNAAPKPPPPAESGVKQTGPPPLQQEVVRPGPGGDDTSRIVSLGKREIEGFKADGERITITIPVNRIGNDWPIEIVEERWKSPELRTTLWSRTSDPRWGETTYQLINIRRGEPDRSLFIVPGDYVIKEDLRKGGGRRPPPIR